MWIIPQAVLAGLSVSAQESVAWTLDSESFTQLAARSLTWRGKDRPSACWRRLLKRERWTRLLSGLTFEPSTAQAIVELWTASLAATPAKERASLGSCAGPLTPGGCGPRSPELCERLAHSGACSRTSPTTSIKDSASSDQSWKRWATELRRVYSLRRKSAQRIAGRDCSSWPSPIAADSGRQGDTFMRGNPTLKGATNWMTPNVPNGGRVMNAVDVAAKGTTSTGKRQADLGSQVRQWPTPTQPYGTNVGGAQGRVGPVRPSLQTMAGQWGTPRATDGEKGGPNMSFGAGGTPLPAQAVSWGTPRVTTNGGSSNGTEYGNGSRLEDQAAAWATPTTRDGKDGGSPSMMAPTNSLLGHQAPRMLTDGSALSLPEGWGSSRLYLNPRFVEWLMGWPDEWTGSAPAEMASYLYRQRLQLATLLTNWVSTGGCEW